jgi:hypothetical protein
MAKVMLTRMEIENDQATGVIEMRMNGCHHEREKGKLADSSNLVLVPTDTHIHMYCLSVSELKVIGLPLV